MIRFDIFYPCFVAGEYVYYSQPYFLLELMSY